MFITGNVFKSFCHYSYDEQGFLKNDTIDNNMVFVKTDLIYDFYNKFYDLPFEKPAVIITHNSDLPITDNHLNILNSDVVQKWYAQNVCVNHPKLKPIPIGIANERIRATPPVRCYHYGAHEILKNVMYRNVKKDRLVYCNFDTNTNLGERNRCAVEMLRRGIPNRQKEINLEDYLMEIARSHYIITPIGNSIDTHRHWESLYLKTIPVVTEVSDVGFYKMFPFEVIKDWESFDATTLTIEKYIDKITNFDMTGFNAKDFLI